MEPSIWLAPFLFKDQTIATVNQGRDLFLTQGRFDRIPFRTRWVGWFLSDVEPNYSWKLILDLLKKSWQRLSLESLDIKILKCVGDNLKKALEITQNYEKLLIISVLSKFSENFVLETDWIEEGLKQVDTEIEAKVLKMKKKEIVTHLISSFSKEDIEVPGIFRLSSPKADVEVWSKKLLNDPDCDLTSLSPLLRATLLKWFLKKLVLFKKDENFIAAGNTEENQWERLNRLMLAVQNLPEDNRQILEMVLPLLRKVADYKQNNINAKNLGVCMGQDMLSLEEDDDLNQLAYSNEAFSLLIENQEKIL
jgi:hypothetical protein